MSNTQAKLGTAMLKSLISLREQKGAVNIEDVGAILESMAHTLHTSDGEADRFLREEIRKMAAYIGEANKEILALGANTQGNNSSNLADASERLGAVVKATEEATGRILDAAEEIQTLAGKMGEPAKPIVAAGMRIIEACNFQDLTGQRIAKVLKVLDHLETRILRLAELFRTEAANANGDGKDNSLLSGPPLPDNAATQADIDALFSGLQPKK